MTAPESKIASIALAQSGAERKGLEVTLMTGQIDLWPIALPQPGDDSFANRMMVCERGLSNDERIRAKRYEPRRRAEFVITRGTMREILRRYAEQQTSRLVFQVGPFGKPSLANSAIRFNLTHTAGLAMLAVSRHREIGIDIWGRQMAWQAGRLGRGRFDAGSHYPGLGLRRLLLQRRFPGLRRRAGLWNQPAYSRNQESESSSPRERVPEKSVPEKHASEAAAVESKTESKHKTGRSRKKRHRGD